MRIRHTLGAAAGAALLVLALPTSAGAAEGSFTYKYRSQDRAMLSGKLVDPPSEQCITLDEADDPKEVPPAHSPYNGTDETATVFEQPGCEGDSFDLEAGAQGSAKLEVRSVVFHD
ncbi:hypothetical protein DEJ50_19705 [Streptomyces venezuelae]|uniref:Secreted protein n=1 Tax=Streptomyces venezuelae TaxID=54571 RepID=A0A5P2D3G3_STRVZ|nr:hypothetical protein [Streptomyces venezuelae]QES49702.1 hypothetical protein DEJ50_19705 [Streptomyces venezuelae]